MEYPGEVLTRTIELNTVKIHRNSVLSAEGARYMNADLKDFYLNTPMKRFECAKFIVDYIPEATMNMYNFWELVHDGFM